MRYTNNRSRLPSGRRAFTLVEMLVVIAIISILMTAGSIGLRGMGGKGVTSGVATLESLFEEARTTAVSRNLRSAVVVAKTLQNNRAEELRRVFVVYEAIETRANHVDFGKPLTEPHLEVQNWMLGTRGALLPDQTFFSQEFSRRDHGGGDRIDTIKDSNLKTPSNGKVKSGFEGEYFIYEFNSQGIIRNPGTSVVIGSGARNLTKPSTEEAPRLTSDGKRDFGGFVVWRNGRTSVFRSPDQIDGKIKNLQIGAKF